MSATPTDSSSSLCSPASHSATASQRHWASCSGKKSIPAGAVTSPQQPTQHAGPCAPPRPRPIAPRRARPAPTYQRILNLPRMSEARGSGRGGAAEARGRGLGAAGDIAEARAFASVYERLREIGPNSCACASGPAEDCAKWLMRRRREADVPGIVKFYLDKS